MIEEEGSEESQVPTEEVKFQKEVDGTSRENMPLKLKDLVNFVISVAVRDSRQIETVLNLGASINMMPFALYKQLRISGIKPTTINSLISGSLG